MAASVTFFSFATIFLSFNSFSTATERIYHPSLSLSHFVFFPPDFRVVYCIIVFYAIHADVGGIQFTYRGDRGPYNWGNLSPKFDQCKNGKSQSPIDIVKHKAVINKKLKPLIRKYHSAVNVTLVNYGFTVGVSSFLHALNSHIKDPKICSFFKLHNLKFSICLKMIFFCLVFIFSFYA